MVSQPATTTAPNERGGAKLLLLLLLGFVLLAAPRALFFPSALYELDEREYHLPAIRRIAAHWPGVDWTEDCPAAMGPGYHYVLASFVSLGGAGLKALRVAHLAVCFAFIWLLFAMLRREVAAWEAFLLTLPVLASKYFVVSSSWIGSDTPAMLLALPALALVLRRPGEPVPAWMGLAPTLAIPVRQNQVWAGLPPLFRVLAQWWRARRAGDVAAPSAGRLGEAMVFAILPFAVLAALVIHWGGLVPPAWRSALATSGFPLKVVPLCYIAALSGVFFALLMPELLDDLRASRAAWRWGLVGAAAGLLIALLEPSTTNQNAGRWGGPLWAAANVLPSFQQRSLVFLSLCPPGGFVLGVVARRLLAPAAWVRGAALVAAWAAWAFVQTANRLVFHRYYEVYLLVFAAFARAIIFEGQPMSRRARWCVLALALAQVGITLASLYAGENPLTWVRSLQVTRP